MKAKLLIIGAGPSGLAAGERLIDSSFQDFIILEARHRIGGRINSILQGSSYIELGAQWIHGEEGNVTYGIAKAQDLLSRGKDGSSQFMLDEASEWSNVLFLRSDGSALMDSSSRKIGFVTSMMESMELGLDCDEYRSAGNHHVAAFNEMLQENRFHELQAEREAILDWIHRYINSVDAADDWEQVANANTYWRCPGNTNVCLEPKLGYVSVLNHLKRKFGDQHLMLGKEVTEINYSNKSIIAVTCADGTRFECQKCILTLPLGVLKNRPGIFVPSLPQRKKDAIDALGFGAVDKIFLIFKTRWWPETAGGGFSFLWTNEPEPEYQLAIIRWNERKKFCTLFQGWPRSLLGFYADPGYENVLCGWISGDGARAMEKVPVEKVEYVCVALLRKFTRGLNLDIPEPVAIHRSTWGSDEFSRGSYSYRSVVCDEKGIGAVDLAEPVCDGSENRLYFAGEATHSNFYSTVHGAIETGYREADRFIEDEKRDLLK
ncbi:unnamed protein product [Notodromas monacha]|uniref:Amine oxidase domain-containing protein n=1 Tax=Notodromas monacha TaxID=399045 RepID=A0A7R9GAQ5_9CRUS|nr:unnamed protein product [Notodromas monacha]CAG0914239.1 unnamed protein product [Notodromas monacha]